MAHKKGFTLIEIVVVVFIIAMLSLVVSSFMVQSFSSYRIKRQSIDLEEKAASVMREFEQSARAATEILSATDDEFVFYRFYDLNSSSPKKVRYFIENNQFKVGVTDPFGTEPNVTYPPENETIELIVDNVVNSDVIFKYFDSNNEELTSVSDLNAIKMVELDIQLDKNKEMPPAPISETTKVNLRNMKDNL